MAAGNQGQGGEQDTLADLIGFISENIFVEITPKTKKKLTETDQLDDFFESDPNYIILKNQALEAVEGLIPVVTSVLHKYLSLIPKTDETGLGAFRELLIDARQKKATRDYNSGLSMTKYVSALLDMIDQRPSNYFNVKFDAGRMSRDPQVEEFLSDYKETVQEVVRDFIGQSLEFLDDIKNNWHAHLEVKLDPKPEFYQKLESKLKDLGYIKEDQVEPIIQERESSARRSGYLRGAVLGAIATALLAGMLYVKDCGKQADTSNNNSDLPALVYGDSCNPGDKPANKENCKPYFQACPSIPIHVFKCPKNYIETQKFDPATGTYTHGCKWIKEKEDTVKKDNHGKNNHDKYSHPPVVEKKTIRHPITMPEKHPFSNVGGNEYENNHNNENH